MRLIEKLFPKQKGSRHRQGAEQTDGLDWSQCAVVVDLPNQSDSVHFCAYAQPVGDE